MSYSRHKNIKHIIWKCVTVQKLGDNSNELKIGFRRKLRGDWILVILASTWSRTFCLLICCQNT
jgi:hypothetical protein